MLKAPASRPEVLVTPTRSLVMAARDDHTEGILLTLVNRWPDGSVLEAEAAETREQVQRFRLAPRLSSLVVTVESLLRLIISEQA